VSIRIPSVTNNYENHLNSTSRTAIQQKKKLNIFTQSQCNEVVCGE